MAWNDTSELKKRFSFVCDVSVGDMEPVSDGVRHCTQCQKSVHRADSDAHFDALARAGQCVFVVSQQGAAFVSAPDGPPPGPPRTTAGAPAMPDGDMLPKLAGKPVPRKPPLQATAGIPFDPDGGRRWHEARQREAEQEALRAEVSERREPPRRGLLVSPLAVVGIVLGVVLGVAALAAVVAAVIMLAMFVRA